MAAPWQTPAQRVHEIVCESFCEECKQIDFHIMDDQLSSFNMLYIGRRLTYGKSDSFIYIGVVNKTLSSLPKDEATSQKLRRIIDEQI